MASSRTRSPIVTIIGVVVVATLVLSCCSNSLVYASDAIPRVNATTLWVTNVTSPYCAVNAMNIRSNYLATFSYYCSSSTPTLNAGVLAIQPSGVAYFNDTKPSSYTYYYKAASGGYSAPITQIGWAASAGTSINVYIRGQKIDSVSNVKLYTGLNGDSYDLALSPDGKYLTLVYAQTPDGVNIRGRTYRTSDSKMIADVYLGQVYASHVKVSISQGLVGGYPVYYAVARIPSISAFVWNPELDSKQNVTTLIIPDCLGNGGFVVSDKYIAITCRSVYVWKLTSDYQNRTAIPLFVLPPIINGTVDLGTRSVTAQINGDTLVVASSLSNTVASYSLKKSASFKSHRSIDPVKSVLLPQPQLVWITNYTSLVQHLPYPPQFTQMLSLTPDGKYAVAMVRSSFLLGVVVLNATVGTPLFWSELPTSTYIQAITASNGKSVQLLVGTSQSSFILPSTIVWMLQFNVPSKKEQQPWHQWQLRQQQQWQQLQQERESEHHVYHQLQQAVQLLPFNASGITDLAAVLGDESSTLIRQHSLESSSSSSNNNNNNNNNNNIAVAAPPPTVNTNHTNWVSSFTTTGAAYNLAYSAGARKHLYLSTQSSNPNGGIVSNCSLLVLDSNTGVAQHNASRKATSAQLSVARMSANVVVTFFTYNLKNPSCEVFTNGVSLGVFTPCLQSCCSGQSAVISPDGSLVAIVTSNSSIARSTVQFFGALSHKLVSVVEFDGTYNDRVEWYVQHTHTEMFLLVETYYGVYVIDPASASVRSIVQAPDCRSLRAVQNQYVILNCQSVYIFDLSNISQPQLLAYLLPPGPGWQSYASLTAPLDRSGLSVSWNTYVGQKSQFIVSAYSFTTTRNATTGAPVQTFGSRLWSTAFPSGVYILGTTSAPDGQYLVVSVQGVRYNTFQLAVIPFVSDGIPIEYALVSPSVTPRPPMVARYRSNGNLEVVISTFNANSKPTSLQVFSSLFDAHK